MSQNGGEGKKNGHSSNPPVNFVDGPTLVLILRAAPDAILASKSIGLKADLLVQFVLCQLLLKYSKPFN